MERLRNLVGYEHSLAELTQTLYFEAQSMAAGMVGALHVTCADETEAECVEAFQHGFVQYLLPPLKFAHRSAFRVANLGGRYEWSAVRLAEAHFAPVAPAAPFKLILVKINAHVAYEDVPGGAGGAGFRLGMWQRYGVESPCCGALHALTSASREPYVEALREVFRSEGRDRVATLGDPSAVDPTYRALYAALVSARLQARTAVLDIQDYTPVAPTLFVVVPCVTLNRHERDTEILCGVYEVDSRTANGDTTYFGLGDDPSSYEIETRNRLFRISDEHVGQERKGRDHRALVQHAWRAHRGDKDLTIQDDRLERIREDVARNKHRDHHHARTLLRAALPILAEVAPVPAAILLFADGAVGIHHAFRVHTLAREMEGTAEARSILDEVHASIDKLDPDRAEALIEMLMKEYAR